MLKMRYYICIGFTEYIILRPLLLVITCIVKLAVLLMQGLIKLGMWLVKLLMTGFINCLPPLENACRWLWLKGKKRFTMIRERESSK